MIDFGLGLPPRGRPTQYYDKMRRAVELQEEYACESKARKKRSAYGLVHTWSRRTRRAHQITLVTSAHFARSLARERHVTFVRAARAFARL